MGITVSDALVEPSIAIHPIVAMKGQGVNERGVGADQKGMGSDIQDSGGVALPIGFLEDLAAASSIVDVLNVSASWVRKLVAADRTSIALWAPGTAELTLFALDGAEAVPINASISIPDSHVGRSITARRQDYVRDLPARDGDEYDIHRLVVGGFRSSVVTPLIGGGDCYGSLNAASMRTNGFTSSHLDTLRGTAGLIASYLRIHRQVEAAKELVRTDELTGLLSRRAVIEELRLRLNQHGGSDPVSVLFADLNDFKLINDAYGHAAGDVVLCEVSRRFQRALRAGDIVGRMGGDEFLVVLAAPSRDADALRVADRLVDACRTPITIGTLTLAARPSIGVACATDESVTVEMLLAEADQAMYEAKRSATDVVLADDGVRRHVDLVAAVDRDIEAAVRNDDLAFHYQGVFEFETREMLGFEALVRWDHPTQGPIPPPLLVERIEAKGLTSEFTRWSLDRVAADLRRLRSRFPAWSDKAVAMNLNVSQLDWSGYVELHLGTLVRFGLRPADIIIEIVEHQAVEPGSRAEETLRKLGSYGVIIALDDFGAGHNVLGYFGRFPINSIKFDRSLTAAIVSNDMSQKVVGGLVHIARELGVDVVVEGVERDVEIEAARRIGINRGQGFLLGDPAPIDALADAWEEWEVARSEALRPAPPVRP